MSRDLTNAKIKELITYNVIIINAINSNSNSALYLTCK